MQDWISDWKRWSRAERCFAIVLVILSLVIPLGLLIAAAPSLREWQSLLGEPDGGKALMPGADANKGWDPTLIV